MFVCFACGWMLVAVCDCFWWLRAFFVRFCWLFVRLHLWLVVSSLRWFVVMCCLLVWFVFVVMLLFGVCCFALCFVILVCVCLITCLL